MENRYSLATYTMTLIPNDTSLQEIFGQKLEIGGKGSHVGQISISTSGTLWSVQSFATGGYTFDKNLDRTGSISLEISQLSDEVQKFIRLCNLYYSSNEDYEGLTISVTANNGNKTLVTCIDCFPSKIQDQTFGSTASNQTWEFICGKVTYKDLA